MAIDNTLIGEQAKGAAGVLGQGSNPLSYFLQNQAMRQKREEDLMAEERKRRDAYISDLRKFEPDKVWSPFFAEVNKYAQDNVFSRFHQMSQQGHSLSAIDADLQKRKGETNTLVSKANFLKEQYDQAAKEIDNNPYYDKNKAHSALNDIFFNGRQAKPLAEINSDDISKVFDSNLNENAVLVDFMKSVPEKINETYTKQMGQYGEKYDVTETKTRAGLQYTPDGKLVLDPRTGQPKISVTDDVLVQARANPYVQKILNSYVPDGNIQKQREVLGALVEGLDPKTVQTRVQLGFRKPDEDRRYNAFGRDWRTNPADLADRYNWAKEVTENNRPDQLARANDPNSDNQVFYGNAKGEPIKPGDKPATIVIARVGQPEEKEKPENWDSMQPFEQFIWLQTKMPSRIVKKDVIPVTTPEGKRRAQIELSNRIDKLDAKRSIGPDEFGNYVEARYKDEEKNKPKKGSGAFDNF